MADKPEKRLMGSIKFSMDDQPSDADTQTLIRNLVSYNNAQAQKEDWQALAIFIRDDGGVIAGGLDGYTHWGWLFISHLWLTEALRGRGYGTQLVEQAEQEAIQRGCHGAYLDTFDFQALGFYRKLGYDVFGVLEDFPPGHRRYFLQKRLL